MGVSWLLVSLEFSVCCCWSDFSNGSHIPSIFVLSLALSLSLSQTPAFSSFVQWIFILYMKDAKKVVEGGGGGLSE
jgi:hypothetical protein